MKTNRSESVIQSEPACRNGFTLLDLLVVLGVIAVLITLQLPVLASGKSQTKIGVCASHVRQLALACQLYANDNNDRLPVLSGVSWPWDLPVGVASWLLVVDGVATNTFYCPGTAPRFNDNLNFGNTASGSSLWNYSPSSYRIAGYAFAFSGTASTLDSTNQNSTMLPETIQTGSPAPAASKRVLVADATLNTQANGYGSWTDIAGGFTILNTSPHLNGLVPAGGNVGFKDGHVEWRNFKDMNVRTGGNTPAFWW
jgi:type II secretory pathway pseudopilin PulG